MFRESEIRSHQLLLHYDHLSDYDSACGKHAAQSLSHM
jgi:hypothetical protein